MSRPSPIAVLSTAMPRWWEQRKFVYGVGLPVTLFLLILVGVRYGREEDRYFAERNVVSMLRRIYEALNEYAKEYGNGFPPSLAALAHPVQGNKPSCRAADLLAAGMAESLLRTGQVRSYRFEYRPGMPVENPRLGCPPGAKSYMVAVRPSEKSIPLLDIHKKKSFLLEESGVVRWTTEDRQVRTEDPVLTSFSDKP